MDAHLYKGEDKWPSQCQSTGWDPMCGETHPHPLVPPFLLMKNQSPKYTAGSEIMNLKSRYATVGLKGLKLY